MTAPPASLHAGFSGTTCCAYHRCAASGHAVSPTMLAPRRRAASFSQSTGACPSAHVDVTRAPAFCFAKCAQLNTASTSATTEARGVPDGHPGSGSRRRLVRHQCHCRRRVGGAALRGSYRMAPGPLSAARALAMLYPDLSPQPLNAFRISARALIGACLPLSRWTRTCGSCASAWCPSLLLRCGATFC